MEFESETCLFGCAFRPVLKTVAEYLQLGVVGVCPEYAAGIALRSHDVAC